jgi:1,4-alpha-glucan branching enzyme
MSRARHAMYLFTDSKTALKEAVLRTSERVSAYELLVGDWRRDRAATEESARDALREIGFGSDINRNAL